MADALTTTEPIGIFTRTVAKSPVVRQLLQARVRRADAQDVIFVGEDFIHVKEVRENGHLHHIATKDDFQCCIRAANIFTIDLDHSEEDPTFIKREDGVPSTTDPLPPQLLALTLANDQLVFIYLRQDAHNCTFFIQIETPLPILEERVSQPGEHLAIESHSRAVAVAAHEGEVILWPAKDKGVIKAQLKGDPNEAEILGPPRYFHVNGVIAQMDFLIPHKNDPDHIILLVLIISDERLKAVWFDWQAGADIYQARVHPPQSLDRATSVPSLLIPIQNTAFLLVCGHEIRRWRGLVTGTATASPLDIDQQGSEHPGMSPKKPLWASWCRPRRTPKYAHEMDVIYLAREDGVVYFVEMINENRAKACMAGTFGCHVGAAFVSLGDDWLPDVLAVAGDTSTGQIVSIGQWPSSEDFEQPWIEAMQMELVEAIPNWSAVTDMVTTSLPHSHSRLPRSRDGIFVTSGRQPYGAVTELREGIEAQQVFYMEDDNFKSLTEAWVYSWPATRSMLVVLSDPVSTTFLEVAFDGREVSALDESSLPNLVTSRRTLALEADESGLLVQITEASICVADPARGRGSCQGCDDNVSIICAATSLQRQVVVTCEWNQDEYTLKSFRCHLLNDVSGDAMSVDPIRSIGSLSLATEPLCTTIFSYHGGLFVVVIFASNLLKLFQLSDGNITEHDSSRIDHSDDTNPACDHVVALQAPSEDKLLLVCGRRDGKISSFVVDIENQRLCFRETFVTRFGQASVKVTQLDAVSACAMSGLDMCKISWDGSSSLEIQNVWLTDKLRPEFSQGPVTACRSTPTTNSLTNTPASLSCMVVSAAEIMFTEWAERSSTVPRHIQVQGSPNRLIYAELERQIVVSSVCTEARSFPRSNARTEQRRQIYPAVSFIHPRKNIPSYTHVMEVGEVVNALAEWSFKDPREGKVYSFIIVAGSISKGDGTPARGRITFLQPKHDKREIVGISNSKTRRFDDPVWALAFYDDITFVISTGDYLDVLRFNSYTGEWNRGCPPIKLASRAIQITVDEIKRIHVSTARDSVMTLALTTDETNRVTLRHCSLSPFASVSLSHLLIQSPVHDNPITVLSTRDQELHGVLHPDYPPVTGRFNSRAIFHARLPQSLLRLRHAKTRPPWSDPLPTPHSPIIAATAAGSLQILLHIPANLWRRLFWLQRLLEWDMDLLTPYSPPEEEHGSIGRTTRPVPVGLSSSSTSTISLSIPDQIRSEGDMHIDGDVLARIFHGQLAPRERLASVLRTCIEREQGSVGDWVRQNFEMEVDALDELIGHIKALCFGWI